MIPSAVSERELPLIQRGIVDNCFEEGQYEYGIDVLDKLRAQRYKPSPLHIRQLLYISLYPLPQDPSKHVDRVEVPPSPQKVRLQRQKEHLWPKPTSRPLAIALLQALASTNSPESLMRGLPFHSYTNDDGTKDVDPFCEQMKLDDRAEDNTPLKGELLAIQSLKDCWGLLRNGLVKRKQVDRYRVGNMDTPHQSRQNDVVGPYAWPVLEWLIQVFEKDERRARGNGQSPHSAILLCHIPPPRPTKGPRWDVEIPLQVAFACFSSLSHPLDQPQTYASSEARQKLGMRLISLLVNLSFTRPPLLSPQHFLRALTLRLLDIPVQSLKAFFSAFTPDQIPFKISLLHSYILSGNGRKDEGSRKIGKSTTTIPRARPKPTGEDTSEEAPVVVAGARERDPYPLPSRDSLLSLLLSPLPSTSTSTPHDSSPSSAPLSATKIALAKFHLVSALYILHLSCRIVHSEWVPTLREGKLRECIVDGFAIEEKTQVERDMVADKERQASDEQEIKSYMSSALEIVRVWEASMSSL